MATYKKRGDSWFVQVRKQGVSKSATFITKAAGQVWATQLEAEIIAGKHSGIAPKTFGELLEKYRDDVSSKKRGSSKESIRINRLLQEPFASVKLADLKDTHFIEWRDRLLHGTDQHRPIKGESVRRYIAILNPAINKAINDWKWLKENPLKGMERPTRSKPRERRPTFAELDMLCFVMGYKDDAPCDLISQRVAAAALFAVETGCRAKEICTLYDVNYDKRTARVPDETKTGAREIALTTRACEILKQVEGNFGLTPSQIDANFRKYKKQAMVSGLTFHDLKHEACTRLAKFMSIEDLARQVGTRNLSILMIYYNPTAAEIALQLP